MEQFTFPCLVSVSVSVFGFMHPLKMYTPLVGVLSTWSNVLWCVAKSVMVVNL